MSLEAGVDAKVSVLTGEDIDDTDMMVMSKTHNLDSKIKFTLSGTVILKLDQGSKIKVVIKPINSNAKYKVTKVRLSVKHVKSF